MSFDSSAADRVGIQWNAWCRRLCLVASTVAVSGPWSHAQGYLELDVATSNTLRIEQARELDAYIQSQTRDRSARARLFAPDYTSPESFVRSAAGYREAFARAIGYPPPGTVPTGPARFEPMGEDEIGVYWRTFIPILPGVQATGIYIVPKQRLGPVPLIVAQHGGAGSPDLALFHGGSNYHDMVRGAVKRGYAVFAPQLLFSSPGLPKESRRETDRRLRLLGTSITAVEVAKIVRSLDGLLARPELDPSRVAMIGLSYGGYYTQVVTALELRIKVAVSSGYFGVNEGRHEENELSIPSDLEFPGRMTLFRDPDLMALICPRPIQLQAGDRDAVHHSQPGQTLAAEASEYYRKVGREAAFEHRIFPGGHEFNDELAWAFVARHL
jgi:dienelactone hydrolase